MDFLKDLVELLKTLLEDTILPDWLKSLVVVAVIVLVMVSLFQKVVAPAGKMLKGLYESVTRRLFINRNMYPYFRGELTPRQVYEAIQYYIPTRYSRRGLDPANEEEPVPENFTKEQERESYPLLLNRFLETEFDSRHNEKFYFVLADCGMGKTTFLMNLFYYTLLRKKRHPCKYINMVNPGVIDAVKKIKEESGANTAETILLLDALDENDAATRNYAEFMRELEEEAREFYCVVITSRTNFFEKETEEHLPGVKRGERVTQDKIVKFYITPFTDNDIQKYLKRRYPWNRKKQKQAWAMMKDNKNLAARPMLLKFMDELLNEDFTFDYDFQLYEKLFDLWISRECDKTGQDTKKLFHECLEIAKAIYRQWEKTGEIGISIEELKALNIPIPDIKLKGHALLNRTSAGKFKFAHKSYWEYLLAYIAFHNPESFHEIDIHTFDRTEAFFLEMLSYIDPYYAALFLGAVGNVIFREADLNESQIYLMIRDDTLYTQYRMCFPKDTVIFQIPIELQTHACTQKILKMKGHSLVCPNGEENKKHIYFSVPLKSLIEQSPILSAKVDISAKTAALIIKQQKIVINRLLAGRSGTSDWSSEVNKRVNRIFERLIQQSQDLNQPVESDVYNYLYTLVNCPFWIKETEGDTMG